MKLKKETLGPRMTPSSKWLLATILAVAFGVPAVADILDELDRPTDGTVVRADAALGGDVVLRWSEPAQAMLIFACLGHHATCVPAWVDPAFLSADRLRPWWTNGSCSLGCVFLRRHDAPWACEPQTFYLPSVP